MCPLVEQATQLLPQVLWQASQLSVRLEPAALQSPVLEQPTKALPQALTCQFMLASKRACLHAVGQSTIKQLHASHMVYQQIEHMMYWDVHVRSLRPSDAF